MKIKLFILVIIIFSFSFVAKEEINPKEYNYDVTIHRDIWGVPHIYGEKDSDAAFGLAYAHAEDDFETIQEVLLALRGDLASVKGKKAAPVDYLTGFLSVWKTIEEKYETELSTDIKNVCEAYADGINRYIEKYPNKVKKGVYHVSGKDIVAGFVFRTPLMFELDWYIKELMKDKKPTVSQYSQNN